MVVVFFSSTFMIVSKCVKCSKKKSHPFSALREKHKTAASLFGKQGDSWHLFFRSPCNEVKTSAAVLVAEQSDQWKTTALCLNTTALWAVAKPQPALVTQAKRSQAEQPLSAPRQLTAREGRAYQPLLLCRRGPCFVSTW